MHWIANRHSLPPPEIMHNPLISDKSGNTMAMLWIEEMKTHPPAIMMHSSKIKDIDGWTIDDYLDEFVI